MEAGAGVAGGGFLLFDEEAMVAEVFCEERVVSLECSYELRGKVKDGRL